MNKLKTFENAVAQIEAGSVIMLGGFMTVGTPEKLVLGMGGAMDLCIGPKKVDRLKVDRL